MRIRYVMSVREGISNFMSQSEFITRGAEPEEILMALVDHATDYLADHIDEIPHVEEIANPLMQAYNQLYMRVTER